MLKRVYLEITNSCNLNCPFCTNQKGNRYLSIEEIKDYLSQIKPFCNYIYLHILGEPLLHPNFNEILEYLDQNNFKLQLVTNGTLLNKYPNILDHQCLRKLSISVHSINNINVDNNYFDTLNSLIENNTNTKLELRFYDKQNLDNKLESYLDYLKNKYAFEITAKLNSYKLKENTYIYFQELFDWPSMNDSIINDCGTCHGAIDMIGINSNSDVTICCLDPKPINRIGNLKKDSLETILNSDLYKQYILDFNNHKLTSPLCQRCKYRLRFK